MLLQALIRQTASNTPQHYGVVAFFIYWRAMSDKKFDKKLSRAIF
jgi:hypothetical protein